jgi:hypothetical protein
MLIAAWQLVDRMRHPRTRADELAALRRRFAEAGRDEPSPGEVEAARRLRELRAELSAALSGVTSCAGCARRHPLPHGRWDGGHCCGCRTTDVFTDDEIAALRLAGTTLARLSPPRSDHAGCVFRGPTGCSLDVADRPNICVRYICRELDAELAARGDRAGIRRIAAEIDATFRRLSASRRARRPDDVGP